MKLINYVNVVILFIDKKKIILTTNLMDEQRITTDPIKDTRRNKMKKININLITE